MKYHCIEELHAFDNFVVKYFIMSELIGSSKSFFCHTHVRWLNDHISGLVCNKVMCPSLLP